MRFTRILTSCTITTLVGLSFCALADETTVSGQQLIESNWFAAGAAIQDLRERSTKSFELLDENQSGSITLDEIDLSQTESDMSKMNPEELRQYSRRNSAIQNKFINWSTEVDEFEVVDTNNDGVWNEDEYEMRYQNMQSHRLELGLEEWDADGNGAIELHEFNSHLDELELLDENADGTVSHEEAFKSKNDKVISDVLMNKLKLDEMVWASYSAAGTTKILEMKVKNIEFEHSKE